MSRVLLISVNNSTHPYPVFPLGMSVIAQALSASGREIKLFDLLVSNGGWSQLSRCLHEFNPDYVGISIRNLDSEIDSTVSDEAKDNLNKIKELITLIKETTPKPIIVGGSGFSLMPEDILEWVDADYGIVGEGEVAVIELLDMLDSGVAVTEKILRNESCSKLFGTCNYGSADEISDFYIRESGGILGLQSKRGCCFNCVYCNYPCLEGRSIRLRSTDSVVDDILRMQSDLGCRIIFFADSVFNDPQGYYLELVEEIIRRNIRISWSAYFTPNNLNKRNVELCKRAGLCAVELGADAATDATLKGLNKQFDWDEVVRSNEIFANVDIPCANFIIFGGPGETESTLYEGINNCKSLDRSIVFGYSGIRIFPGTQIWKQAIFDGIIAEDTSLIEPVYYFSPQVDFQLLDNEIKKSWRGCRNLIYPPAKSKAMLEILKTSFNVKGLMWDQMQKFLASQN